MLPKAVILTVAGIIAKAQFVVPMGILVNIICILDRFYIYQSLDRLGYLAYKYNKFGFTDLLAQGRGRKTLL